MVSSAQQLAIVISAVDQTAAPIAAAAKQLSVLASQMKALNEPPKKTGVLGGIGDRVKGIGQVGRDLIRSSGISEFVGTLGKVKEGAVQAASGIASIVTPLAGLSALATVGGIGAMVEHWGKNATDIANLAYQLAVTTTQLQQLTGAAKLAGVPVQSVEQSLAGLMETMRQAQTDATKIRLFEHFGIQIRNANGDFRTTANVAKQIADRLKQIKDPGAQIDFLKKLGLSPEMLPLLRNGGAALEELEKRARHFGLVQSPGQLAAGQALGQSIRDISAAVEGLGNAIAAGLGPVLTPVITAMAEWLAVNRDFIATNVAETIKPIVDYLKQNWRQIGQDIGWIYDKIGGLKGVLIAVAAVSLAPVVTSIAAVSTAVIGLGAVLLANPVAASIVAIAAGAALIYENWDGIVAYFQDKISGVKAAFDQNWVAGVVLAISSFSPATLIGDALNGLSKVIFGFDLGAAAAHMIDTAVDAIKSAWAGLLTWITGEVAKIVAVIQPAIDAYRWLDTKRQAVANAVVAGAEAAGAAVKQGVSGVGESMRAGKIDPATGLPIPDFFGPPTGVVETAAPPGAVQTAAPPAANDNDRRSLWQRYAPEFLGGVADHAPVTIQAPKVDLQSKGAGNSPVSTPLGGGAQNVQTPFSFGGFVMPMAYHPGGGQSEGGMRITVDFNNAPAGTQVDTSASGGVRPQTNVHYAMA